MNLLNILDPDKILAKYFGLKVKLLIISSGIFTVFWVLTTQLNFITILACFYCSVLLLRIGIEVGFHRYFAHRAYQTTYFKSRFLLLLGTSIGVGSCLSWVGVHRTHHQYSDKPQDPHSPHNLGLLRVWFTLWDNNWIVHPAMIKDLLKDKWQVFIHKNYFKIISAWIILLIGISYITNSAVPLVVLFTMPCFFTLVLSGITNGLGHMRGYKSYDSNDNSYNQNLPRWLFLTAGLHNNHHTYPNIWYYNISNKWYEFDIEGLIIKYFLINKK